MRAGRTGVSGRQARSILLAAALAAGAPAAAADIDAAVHEILIRRGLGPDALTTIDNVLRHEAPPPRLSHPVVRELLGSPLEAARVAALFERLVPAGIKRLADTSSTPEPARLGGAQIPAAVPGPGVAGPLAAVIAAYLDEAGRARDLALAAAGGAAIDPQPILETLRTGALPEAAALARLGATLDPVLLDRAVAAFVAATGRLAARLRDPAAPSWFPPAPVRFASALGIVAIGTAGDDVHGPDAEGRHAALIIDPGGNDRYELAPVTGGNVRAIFDLGGNDVYSGQDVVIFGLSAIVDLAGDDRYSSPGAGQGAAIAGVSLIIDLAGNDVYEAGIFAQGAAALGIGALVDLAGEDSYRIRAGGQGFGMAAGLGLLWDVAGNDVYVAAGGLADAFDRGGGRSHAQGAAYGFRTSLAGGIGILRDDQGDDRYEAEMFAQGVAYYYGLGLLWDGAGDDRYRAVRYGQGNGVHEAVGVLFDGAGDDAYELGFGVGQGMGLDLALGLLIDRSGNDRYLAGLLAQGTATANGVGLLADGGGADSFAVAQPGPAWGHAQWARRLPSLGLLLHDEGASSFRRGAEEFLPPAAAAGLGGPQGGLAVVHEPPGGQSCPQTAPEAEDDGRTVADWLGDTAPMFGSAAPVHASFSRLKSRLPGTLRGVIAALPGDDFTLVWTLSEILRCLLEGASPAVAEELWAGMEGALADNPRTRLAITIAAALAHRRPPPARLEPSLAVLDRHPSCGVRATSLALRFAGAAAGRPVDPALAALGDPCWRMQATALAILQKSGAAGRGANTGALPSFLK
ncbi:MAG: hypothetical protein ACT4P2_17455 [Pseudomonadota bacterium]